MATSPEVLPEVKRVLAQVEAELTAMVMAGDVVGSVTVHCGAGDLSVEVLTKKRNKPVRIERTHLLTAVR